MPSDAPALPLCRECRRPLIGTEAGLCADCRETRCVLCECETEEYARLCDECRDRFMLWADGRDDKHDWRLWRTQSDVEEAEAEYVRETLRRRAEGLPDGPAEDVS